MKNNIDGYVWLDSNLTLSHNYLLPMLKDILSGLEVNVPEKKIFDVGCGNGSASKYMQNWGWDVTGIDPSIQGISEAAKNFPDLKLYQGSAYDNLSERFGKFPVVVSLEVIEHLYAPRDYLKTIYDILPPGGVVIISTPYHGYFKNLTMAVFDKMDRHFTALWDHGHIKFWSVKTLSEILSEMGFENIKFKYVGRFRYLSKSMFAIASKKR